MRGGRAAWWLAPLLAAPLGACRPAPVTRPSGAAPPPTAPVTLRVAAGTLTVTGQGPVTVTCDTPAGPLVRTLSAPGRLPLPPGARTCETGTQTGIQTVAAAPAPALGTGPDAARDPAASRAPGLTGALTVTPGAIHLGEREVWTVTADLRRAGGRLPPDGTLVTLTGRGASGEQVQATRLTAGGVARWQLTPRTAGAFTFTATSGAWTARASGTALSGLLGGRPQAIFTGQQVLLGPLRWTDGALPDDGTPVDLRALDRAGRTVWQATVPVAGGQVQADVPRVPGAVTLRAEVAGRAVRFPWR